MRRRLALITAVTAVAAAIVVTAAWFFFVHQTKRAIIQWADIQRDNGVDVTWRDLRFTGYPLRIDAQIGDPQMILSQPNRRTIWKPSFLTFKFSSIAPHTIDFLSPGSHDLHVTHGDAIWSAIVEAQTLEGEASFPPGNYTRIERLAGRFGDVRVTPFAWPDPVTVDRGNFVATDRSEVAADAQAVHPQGVTFELDFEAHDIVLPKEVLKASALESLGQMIDVISTDVQIKGNLDPSSIDVDALAAWRDGGGTVEFTTIELQWGPIRITADGTLALDADLQPVASFATRIAGLEQLITAMEKAGALAPSDAAVARITLAVLTRASADGGPDRALIPITVQERTLRLGPVALIQFPPIVWD